MLLRHTLAHTTLVTSFTRSVSRRRQQASRLRPVLLASFCRPRRRNPVPPAPRRQLASSLPLTSRRAHWLVRRHVVRLRDAPQRHWRRRVATARRCHAHGHRHQQSSARLPPMTYHRAPAPPMTITSCVRILTLLRLQLHQLLMTPMRSGRKPTKVS